MWALSQKQKLQHVLRLLVQCSVMKTECSEGAEQFGWFPMIMCDLCLGGAGRNEISLIWTLQGLFNVSRDKCKSGLRLHWWREVSGTSSLRLNVIFRSNSDSNCRGSSHRLPLFYVKTVPDSQPISYTIQLHTACHGTGWSRLPTGWWRHTASFCG